MTMTHASYNNDSQILGVQNLDARTTWRPGFNHPRAKRRVYCDTNLCHFGGMGLVVLWLPTE